MEDLFCAQISQQEGEQLFGTAVANTKVWFLLEYNRPWQPRATEDNDLSPTVQLWLQQQLETVGNCRLQFIRQQHNETTLTFFIALPENGRLYRFALSSYEDLFALDVRDIVAGATEYDTHLWSQPLYLVCTHGKRDRCCALWGMAYLRALQPLVGSAVWQTTHTGGHRFAPTMITFPDGVMYGRLVPEEAASFVKQHQQKKIILDKYRGQTQYECVVQAADYFLRQEIGNSSLTDLRYVQHQNGDGSTWRVQFAEKNGSLHEVKLSSETFIPDNLIGSCGRTQSKPITQFTYLNHAAVS